MIQQNSLKKPFFLAVGLHLFLAFVLFFEPHIHNPVLTKDTQNMPGTITPQLTQMPQEMIKAVSVDSRELSEAVNKLKAQKAKERQTELNRQAALKKQAEQAKQQRIKEQQQIAKLKKEAEELAIARKKHIEEEKQRITKLAKQKETEAKQLAELKKEQQKELEKLADLHKKHVQEKELADSAAKAAQAKADQAKAEKLANQKKQQAEAQSQARMMGEVNKHTALILNAISRQWIIPENTDRSLSCKVRILLAPDGSVMEVSLLKSSGDPILDRSAQTAIYKASPVPVPSDPALFNIVRDISLTVRPDQIRG